MLAAHVEALYLDAKRGTTDRCSGQRRTIGWISAIHCNSHASICISFELRVLRHTLSLPVFTPRSPNRAQPCFPTTPADLHPRRQWRQHLLAWPPATATAHLAKRRPRRCSALYVRTRQAWTG